MTVRRLNCQWVDPGAKLHDSETEPVEVEVFTDAVIFEQHDGSRQIFDVRELAEVLGLRVEDVRRAAA